MLRFLAGVGSTLLLCAAGFFWWSSRTAHSGSILPSPAYAQETPSGAPEAPQADEKTREQKRFDRYDKDRDEKVSREEYLASRVKAFQRLDVNHDGKLSFDEWAKKSIDKFAGADGDHSGTLDRKEFATTRPVRKSRPKPDCPPAQPKESGEGDD